MRSNPKPLIPVLATAAATVAAVIALFLALAPAGAVAAAADYTACGNTTSHGLLIGDVIARRTTCRNARSIAKPSRRAAERPGPAGSGATRASRRAPGAS